MSYHASQSHDYTNSLKDPLPPLKMATGTPGRGLVGTQLITHLQNNTARDAIISNYEYLVRHVDAIRVFPHLVTSTLVDQDFRQRLDREVTDNDKMMALLQQLNRSDHQQRKRGSTASRMHCQRSLSMKKSLTSFWKVAS